MRWFLAVADYRSFSRASAAQRVQTSALSRAIRGLEDELGVSLFERHSRGVRLTVAGERLRPELRRILAQLDGALSNARRSGRGQEGQLRIGLVNALSSGFLRELTIAWLSDDANVTPSFVEASPRDHIAGIIAREVDVAFLTGSDWPPGCDAEVLWIDNAFAALPTSLDVSGETISLKQIAAERFVVTLDLFGPEIRESIIKRLADLGFSPTIDVIPVGRDQLLHLVGMGFGVSLTSSLETGTQYPGVRFAEVTDLPLPYSAIWSPDNDNPALRRFLSLGRRMRERDREPSRTPDRLP